MFKESSFCTITLAGIFRPWRVGKRKEDEVTSRRLFFRPTLSSGFAPPCISTLYIRYWWLSNFKCLKLFKYPCIYGSVRIEHVEVTDL